METKLVVVSPNWAHARDYGQFLECLRITGKDRYVIKVEATPTASCTWRPGRTTRSLGDAATSQRTPAADSARASPNPVGPASYTAAAGWPLRKLGEPFEHLLRIIPYKHSDFATFPTRTGGNRNTGHPVVRIEATNDLFAV